MYSNSHNVALRIVLDVLLAFCVLHGWWIIALPCAIACAWLFPYLIELVIGGIAYDALFAAAAADTGSAFSAHIGITLSACIFLIMVIIRRIVRR